MPTHRVVRFALHLFGSFRATSLPSARPIGFPTRKCEALLAHLALTPHQAIRREALTALLWSDVPRDQGRHSLRQTLMQLRDTLGPGGDQVVVATPDDTVALAPGAFEVDVVEFERSFVIATPHALDRACELYEGELLDGLVVHEEPFDDWMRGERLRLRQLAIEAYRARLARLASSGGRADAAIRAALRLIALEPLDEDAHRTLMRLYVRIGQPNAAVLQFRSLERVLLRELGLEPDERTRDLLREVMVARARGAVRIPAYALRTRVV